MTTDPRSTAPDSKSPTKEPQTSSQDPNNPLPGNENNLVPEFVEENDTRKSKAGNGFNIYIKELKRLKFKDNPKEVLNMKSARYSWKVLPIEEKEKFKRLGEVDKHTHESSSKEMKKARDAGYRKKKSLKEKTEKEESGIFRKEFEVMIDEKKVRLESLEGKRDNLKKEIESADNENLVVTRLIKDLAEDEASLKSKVKEALVHHKICKK